MPDAPRLRTAAAPACIASAARIVAHAIGVATGVFFCGMACAAAAPGHAQAAHAAPVAAVAQARPVSARIAAPPWPDRHFVYSTGGAPLANVLSDFASAMRVPVASGAQLDGRVEGRFDLPPQRFLDMLARSYDLVWYYDGAVLHVDLARHLPTLVFRLNYARAADLRALLAQTGNDDPRFAPQFDTPAPGLVTVRGFAPYLRVVGEAAQQLETRARERVSTAVRAVVLHYGNAADRTVFANGKTSAARGVASRAAEALGPHGAAFAGAVEYEAALPIVSADPRTNTVLIRDRPERLDADARVIATLDRPASLMMIHLVVAAVAPGMLQTLGMADVDHLRLRPAEAVAALSTLKHATGVQIVADTDMTSVDGGMLAFERELPRAVAVVPRHAGAASDDRGAAPAAEGHTIEGRPAEGRTASFALRILPAVVRPAAGSANGGAALSLAVEWRAAQIDTARETLEPHDALVMVETTPAFAWVVMLVPSEAGDAMAGEIRGEMAAR